METGYEEVREELRGWDIEDLKFGLDWELSLWEKENFDEGLVSAYLDVIDEKDPPPPLPDKYESYEKFRKKVLEKFGMELPPMERETG